MPDADGDGRAAVACGGDDCDDGDAHAFPANVEVCDPAGHDEDCDPTTFGVRDSDHDGHADAACCNTDIAGARHCGDDCNDTSDHVHPGQAEVCDALDNDCDTAVDEMVQMTYYLDTDGDMYGIDGTTTMACTLPTGYAIQGGDCNDVLPMGGAGVNPAAPDNTCDGVNNDCDGSVDEAAPPLVCNPEDLCGDSCTRACSACTRPPSCTLATTTWAWNATDAANTAYGCPNGHVDGLGLGYDAPGSDAPCNLATAQGTFGQHLPSGIYHAEADVWSQCDGFGSACGRFQITVREVFRGPALSGAVVASTVSTGLTAARFPGTTIPSPQFAVDETCLSSYWVEVRWLGLSSIGAATSIRLVRDDGIPQSTGLGPAGHL